jgi:hypothetical protein
MISSLSTEHRTYLVRETALSVAINSALSFLFAWFAAHGRSELPLWGARGVAVDFVPQLLMMMFATTLAVTFLTRKRIRAGALAPLTPAPGGLFARLPRNALLRAVVIALLVASIMWPASIAAMQLLGVHGIAAVAFIVMKVIYGAGLTVIISPWIVLAALDYDGASALRDAERRNTSVSQRSAGSLSR